MLKADFEGECRFVMVKADLVKVDLELMENLESFFECIHGPKQLARHKNTGKFGLSRCHLRH